MPLNQLGMFVAVLIVVLVTPSCAIFVSHQDRETKQQIYCTRMIVEVQASADLDNIRSLDAALKYLKMVDNEYCSVEPESVSLACSVCERWTGLRRTPTLVIGEHAIPIGKDLRDNLDAWNGLADVLKKHSLGPLNEVSEQ